MVDMSNAALRHRFDSVTWGLACATQLAADLPNPPRHLAESDIALRWAADLASVVDVTPTDRRVVAGWPALQPDSKGSWDKSAVDRCDRALDELLAAGRQPAITLLHQDIPGWLDRAGGWLNRDTAYRFADYAAEVGRRFGDRVTRWVTSADFAASSVADYVAGMSPPGRGTGSAGLAAVHHVLLGHGLAVRALRSLVADREVGGTVVLIGGYPATDDLADRVALQRLESWANRIFLDPLLLGRHLETADGDCPVAMSGSVRDGDMEIIGAEQDTLYLSWHSPVRVTTPAGLPRLLPAANCYRALNDLNRLLVRLGFAVVPFDGVPTGSYGWPVLPESLADALAGLTDIYGALLPPLRIVDNGMADAEDPGAHRPEQRRREVLANRLGWLSEVLAAGVVVRGYEYWSILDNLDWVRRYAQLYSISAPSVATPPIPCDWTNSGSFQVRRADHTESRRVLHLI